MEAVMKSFFIVFICVVVFTALFAQVPQLINYQGILTDPSTAGPIADGLYSITFFIYDVPAGGSSIWTETHEVQTNRGLYSLLLGSITPLTATILNGPEKYLGIKVDS